MPRLALLSFLLVGSLLLAGAQQSAWPQSTRPATTTPAKPETDEQDVVRITTNLVQVDAVVTKDGKPVASLKAEDFEIFEDGHPQAIANFSYISNVPGGAPAANSAPANARTVPGVVAPPAVPLAIRPREPHRTIALVVDDLGMSAESMARLRQQVHKFIDEQLEPNDLVAIIRTGGEVGALQQFTTDKRLLANAVDNLRWNHCSRTGMFVFAPLGSGSGSGNLFPCGGRSNLNDTLRVLRFIVRGMGVLPGRISLILLSDSLPIEEQEPSMAERAATDSGSSGDDNPGSGEFTSYLGQLQKVAELAIRGSVVIYSADTRGLQYTGLTAADRLPPGAARNPNVLNSLIASRSRAMLVNQEGSDLIAKETGGFLVRNSNDFGIKRVTEDQQGYYLIGYRPTDESFNRKFHHLTIKVKPRGLSVRTRAGFYGVSEEQSAAKELTTADLMNKALMSPFGENNIAVQLTTLFVDAPDTGSHLRALLHISPGGLTFADQPDGWHVAVYNLGFVVFGENGRVVRQDSRVATARLHGQAYERALRDGIVHVVDLSLPRPGVFQFRVAVRDQSSSRIGSAGQFVQIPNLKNERLALSGLVVWDPTGSINSATTATPSAQSANVGDINSGPAVRQFQSRANLAFACSIYNASIDPATHLPELTAQLRVFRDGKSVYTANTLPVDVVGQTDLKRIVSAGRLQLGPDLQPGNYVLQIVITDRLAEEKRQVATQWIDFQLVK